MVENHLNNHIRYDIDNLKTIYEVNEKKFNKEQRVIYDTIINQVLNPNVGNLSYSYKNLHSVKIYSPSFIQSSFKS